MNYLFQLRPFLAQSLGIFGLVPDRGFTELALYFGETFLLLIEVKDTPSAPLGAPGIP